MKKSIYILTAILMIAGCADFKNGNPYQDTLNILTVSPVYPEGYEYAAHAGVQVIAEDTGTGNRYTSLTDESGTAVFHLSNGLYRVGISDRYDGDLFNGSADRVVVSGSDVTLKLSLAHSKAGSIVIKELYTGGCKKLPEQGDYQTDKYFILHNNHYEVQYLDSLCFGTLSPYNSSASNVWVTKDDATGEDIFPDFVPIIQAVWQMPGDGDDFPLQPGEDAVIALCGAIDHAAQFPLSVNLNREDYFVCYNTAYFPNTLYHPAPGDRISTERYVDVVVKTGKANAYTVSVSSPTLVIWKTQGMTMHEFVNVTGNMTPVPGSLSDNVVKLPYDWVIDAVEVFDARSTNNTKRLPPSLDAGYSLQTDTYLGRSHMRRVDSDASASAGYEVLADTNNSSNDFYETEKQSLHE